MEKQNMTIKPHINTTAVVSFMFAILGYGLLGFIGYKALNDIKRSQERGRGLAIAAVIIAWLTFISIAALVILLVLFGEQLMITLAAMLASADSPVTSSLIETAVLNPEIAGRIEQIATACNITSDEVIPAVVAILTGSTENITPAVAECVGSYL